MEKDLDNLVRLQTYPGGVAAGIRSSMQAGRREIVTVGPSPEFGFIASDPYGTNVATGLVVPQTPSSEIGNARYLFLLARASFGVGEQDSQEHGVRLVGIRQYAELVARIPADNDIGLVSPSGATTTFRREIGSPFWHPPDGNISWHVMTIPKTRRDTRNPANADGFIYQDALSPALLYQTNAPYTPPNGGRPWGQPLGASLGNIHELRYRWHAGNSEYILDIPIPVPCDVVFYASVRQSDPATNPTFTDTTSVQFQELSDEDRFLIAYSAFAQYGTISGSLVFDQSVGENVP